MDFSIYCLGDQWGFTASANNKHVAQVAEGSYHLQLIRSYLGAKWLSGRVLDSRQKGRGFEPHQRHCVVSLSKNIYPSLVLVQPRKTRPYITERLLMGRKESNQTNKNKGQIRISLCGLPLQWMLLLPTPVWLTVHGYSLELCRRSRPNPQIMTFVFLHLLSSSSSWLLSISRASWHILPASPQW